MAFSASRALREALPQKLESLGDEEFKNLQQLQGLLINREEVVFIKPDVDYFTKLAAASGDEADRAFSAALKATYPESVWPTYIEQQTDYSGCTRFGGMTLVDAYRVWLEVQRRFPNRYVNAANEETEAVLHELTQSTCACGNAAGVELELEQFLRRFPEAPARVRIEQRLESLRSRPSDIRPNCTSG